MNDILPPKRPLSQNIRPASAPRSTPPTPTPKREPLLLDPAPSQLLIEKKSKRRSGKRIFWWCFGGVLAVGILLIVSVIAWYTIALQPAASRPTDKVTVEIAGGSSPSGIGRLLEEKRVIRSSLAFDIYTRLSGTRTRLQAGTYNLTPSESTQQIVAHLIEGNVDELSITFLPGATLAENRAVLLKAGYVAAEVDVALGKTYDSPLFKDKPATTDLEGYIYGETYTFAKDATVEEVLERTFAEFYEVIEENNIIAGFNAHGLTLYEGITLASIIQREVSSAADQKQVAQIFLKRLGMDMSLGSDVTYQYIAKKMGITPSPDIDSPYNTRKYTGLPPGPIATPGLSALMAVAAPAPGDYLYFLSGDNDITYFAHTNDEHSVNVAQHCHDKCLLP